MKKLFVFCCVLFTALTSLGQVKPYTLSADTILLTSFGTHGSTLMINSATKDTIGYLFNIGKGVTIFKRAMVTLNDTMHIIGGDTLRTHGLSCMVTYHITADSLYQVKDSCGRAVDSTQFVASGSSGSSGSSGWALTGNGGTTALNFIGTTDNNPLYFRVNNTPAGKIGAYPADRNTSFGSKALISNMGTNNSAFGSLSGNRNTIGSFNTAVGYDGNYWTTSGSYNTAVGALANAWDSAGNNNTALGSGSMSQSGSTTHTHSGNTALGTNALFDAFLGNYNIGLGMSAGQGATVSNTFFVSDSAPHMKYRIDSMPGTPPSVIGKDANGFWHTYQTPAGGVSAYTASNGLSAVGNDIQWGGILSKNDTISLNNKALIFKGTGGWLRIGAAGGSAVILTDTLGITKAALNLDYSLGAAGASLALNSAGTTFTSNIVPTSGQTGNTIYYLPNVSPTFTITKLLTNSTTSTATLSSGAVTVSNTLIKTGAKIFVSVNTPGGTQGFLSAKTSDIINGVSFIINSTSLTENSTVNYQFINP